jgi:hypothetical protein
VSQGGGGGGGGRGRGGAGAASRADAAGIVDGGVAAAAAGGPAAGLLVTAIAVPAAIAPAAIAPAHCGSTCDGPLGLEGGVARSLRRPIGRARPRLLQPCCNRASLLQSRHPVRNPCPRKVLLRCCNRIAASTAAIIQLLPPCCNFKWIEEHGACMRPPYCNNSIAESLLQFSSGSRSLVHA